VAIPFAIQAVRLLFDASGEFLTTEALQAGEAAARAMASAPVQECRHRVLAAPGAFVRVESSQGHRARA
jgi:hypothetical protein